MKNNVIIIILICISNICKSQSDNIFPGEPLNGNESQVEAELSVNYEFHILVDSVMLNLDDGFYYKDYLVNSFDRDGDSTILNLVFNGGRCIRETVYFKEAYKKSLLESFDRQVTRVKCIHDNCVRGAYYWIDDILNSSLTRVYCFRKSFRFKGFLSFDLLITYDILVPYQYKVIK